MSFVTFTVGRSDTADIHILDESVSRRHLEVTVTGDKRIYIVDAGSSGGTCIRRQESWEELRQGFVSILDVLKLGDKQIKVKELMERISSLPTQSASSLDPVTIKPKRSAATGEVIV